MAMSDLTRRGRKTVIGALVAAALVVNLVGPGLLIGNDVFVLVAAGAIAAEACLLAIWAALGPQTVAVRLLITLPLLVLCICAYITGVRQSFSIDTTPQPFQTYAAIVMAAELMFIWVQVPLFVFVQVPLWVARVRSGRWIDLAASPDDGNDRRVIQFGLRYLLALTTVVALLLLVVRYSVGSASWDLGASSMEWLYYIATLAMYTVVSTLVCLPCVWLILDRGRDKLAWLIWFVAATAAGPLLTAALLPVLNGGVIRFNGDTVIGTYCFTIGLAMTTILVLLAVRKLGYRLVGSAAELDSNRESHQQ